MKVCYIYVFTSTNLKTKEHSVKKLPFEIGLDTQAGFEHKVIW